MKSKIIKYQAFNSPHQFIIFSPPLKNREKKIIKYKYAKRNKYSQVK